MKNLLHKITFQEDGVVLVKRDAKRDFSGSGKVEYDILSSPDKRNVREIAVLLDSHFVSNVFWEQLSATVPNLPTLRLVNSYREKLDSRINVFRTRGSSPGAQVSFQEELRL